MSHRVIAGRAKGLLLKGVPGDKTRPITDRVKEALFNILGMAVVDASILDLYAGTGAVGIEALSRGAAHATFIDKERAAVKTIHDNLRHTRLAENAAVLRADAFQFLKRTNADPFSIVYVAPPQYLGIWKETLFAIDTQLKVLEPDAIIIVQIDPKEQEPIALTHLQPYDERTYGNTLLWFFEYDPGEG